MPKQDHVCEAPNWCLHNRRIIYNSLFRDIPEPQGIIPEFRDILFRILILDRFQFRSNVVHFLSLAIYISLIRKKRLTLATEQYLDYSSYSIWFKKTRPCIIPQDNRKLNLVTHYLNVMTLFL